MPESAQPRIRLDRDAFEDLKKKLPPIQVTNQTTDLQAGFQLGVQAVLEKLEAGWVVSRR